MNSLDNHSEGCTYSIDMLRLRVEVSVSSLQFLVDMLQNYLGSKMWVGRSIKDYKYNFSVSELNYSFYLAFLHNTERLHEKSKVSLVIEFNPNKCSWTGSTLLSYILTSYFVDDPTVVSLDVAVDIPVNINSIIVDRQVKRRVLTYDLGGDNKTIYVGQGNGRVKIYNKAREMGLDVDLTRMEISIKFNGSMSSMLRYSFDYEFPKVYVVNSANISNNAILSACIYACLNGFSLSSFSRKYRNKLKAILNSVSLLDVKNERITNVIRSFASEYFKYVITSIIA